MAKQKIRLFNKRIIRLDKFWKKDDIEDPFRNIESVEYGPYKESDKKDLDIDLNRVLANLNTREEKIIRYCFGIKCEQLNFAQIVKLFNIKEKRVKKIKEKAIRRLKHSTRANLLRKYL